MNRDPFIPAGEFPNISKVQALKLPMKTIKDFLVWHQEHYPGKVISELDHSRLLYEYYNVDLEKLVDEMDAAQRR